MQKRFPMTKNKSTLSWQLNTKQKLHAIRTLSDNYTYVLSDSNNKALIIDPGEAEPVIEYCQKNKLIINAIANTHHHPDHVSGNTAIAERTSSTLSIYCSQRDIQRVPLGNFALSDGDSLSFSDYSLQAYAVPGHTQGQIAFFCARFRILFPGDTLFVMGCGRLLEGTASELFSSLQRLVKLPSDTLIFSGHEYAWKNAQFAHSVEPDNEIIKKSLERIESELRRGDCSSPTTLAEELQTNPFLRTSSLTLRNQLGLSKNETDLSVFTTLRHLRDHF